MHVNNFLSICPPFFQSSIFLPLLTTNTCKIERKKRIKEFIPNHPCICPPAVYIRNKNFLKEKMISFRSDIGRNENHFPVLSLSFHLFANSHFCLFVLKYDMYTRP